MLHLNMELWAGLICDGKCFICFHFILLIHTYEDDVLLKYDDRAVLVMYGFTHFIKKMKSALNSTTTTTTRFKISSTTPIEVK